MKTWQALWLRIPRVIRWSIVDAVLLAGGAALYGMLFGGFEAAVHHEPGRVLAAMGCFALGGLIAGAILGMSGALMDSPEPAAHTESTDLDSIPAAAPSGTGNVDRTFPCEAVRRSRETYMKLRAANVLGSHHFRM